MALLASFLLPPYLIMDIWNKTLANLKTPAG